MFKDTAEPESSVPLHTSIRPLGTLKPRTGGIVTRIIDAAAGSDLERQLLEIGFVEGARVELLHQGPFGDPLAIRINRRLTVALRRQDANAILVAPLGLPS